MSAFTGIYLAYNFTDFLILRSSELSREIGGVDKRLNMTVARHQLVGSTCRASYNTIPSHYLREEFNYKMVGRIEDDAVRRGRQA